MRPSKEYLERERAFIKRILASLAAEAADPERKPVEAHVEAIDAAGGSSEADAGQRQAAGVTAGRDPQPC
jgi:hypothetical protein